MHILRQAISALALYTLAHCAFAAEDPGGVAPDPNSVEPPPPLEAAAPDPNEATELAVLPPVAAADPNAPMQETRQAPTQPQLAAEAADPNDPMPETNGSEVASDSSGDQEDVETPAEVLLSAAVEDQENADEAGTQEPASKNKPDSSGKDTSKGTGKEVMDMAAVIALVQQQQVQLARQDDMLTKQSRQLEVLRGELDALRAPPVTEEPVTLVATQDQQSQPIDIAIAGKETDGDESAPKTTQEKQKATSESVATAQADDPTKQILTDFPGAWRLPGTQAALAIGGYVKSTIVYNYDPLEIKDRFIVGSIPVDSSVVSSREAESSISASQSRLNFDLREPTDVGILRAFIEGDFAEENETFRLRHAFGQWNRLLAGKTWSAFVDTQATPEEIDFEGLNGRINVRQPQMRVTPQVGESFEFQFSLEDPNPEIQNGSGVTRAPDLVMSGRFQPHDRLHTKVAVLGRQIRAQREVSLGGGVEKQYAWGLTVSGRYSTPRFGAKDSLLFQLNAGDGIGRYVNDLSSVGNYDGIFNPESGDLELFDIVAGYVSFQHWWGGTSRSNFTLGAVSVDNPNFVEGDAYKETIRASANYLWTPTPRIDLGFEFLWGQREDQDGSNGDAKQIQVGARYRF